jgi:hypothetical protein
MNNAIKIEKSVRDEILSACESRGKIATIGGTKNINTIKKIAQHLKMSISDNGWVESERRCLCDGETADIAIYNPQGEWNGYGYTKLPKECDFPKLKIRNFLKNDKKTVEKKPVRRRTQEEITESWCKRLAKLTGITIEEAQAIAQEKENYKFDKIQEMIERDNANPSIRRGKLIAKMERENPLRPINDESHAQAILAASERHNETDYESKLEEGREEAMLGNIDRSEVKEYARSNMSHA